MSRITLGLTAGSAALSLAMAVAVSQEAPDFGDEESVAFAEALWQVLEEERLVGEDALRSYAYQGTEPHGIVLEQVERRIVVNGHEDIVVVKSNFMADGLTPEQVVGAERKEHLDATTVMFRREAGYAPDTGDWFWVKYDPGGAIDQTPDGVALAGRVGMCIECHAGAPGDDFVFLHDRYGAR